MEAPRGQTLAFPPRFTIVGALRTSIFGPGRVHPWHACPILRLLWSLWSAASLLDTPLLSLVLMRPHHFWWPSPITLWLTQLCLGQCDGGDISTPCFVWSNEVLLYPVRALPLDYSTSPVSATPLQDAPLIAPDGLIWWRGSSWIWSVLAGPVSLRFSQRSGWVLFHSITPSFSPILQNGFGGILNLNSFTAIPTTFHRLVSDSMPYLRSDGVCCSYSCQQLVWLVAFRDPLDTAASWEVGWTPFFIWSELHHFFFILHFS